MTFRQILRDTRERKPYEFGDYSSISTTDVTLSTGDYTFEVFCEYDAEVGTYHPTRAIERKAGQDFVSSITRDRERFKAEIKRAAEWPEPLTVVVEAPWETFMEERDFMQYRDVHPNQIRGVVDSWQKHYNVEFSFHDGRHDAEQTAFDTLLDWYRDLL